MKPLKNDELRIGKRVARSDARAKVCNTEKFITDCALPNMLNVSLDEKVGDGTYCNLALIAFDPAEFFVDFARLVPGVPKASIQARSIMTPDHVKFLMNALKENIERFENQLREITLHGQPPQGGASGFKSPESSTCTP